VRYPGPLLQGTLVRRYQRFFADVRLRNGHVVTAHTPNTGRMLGCSAPGSRVWISRADPARRRRLRYTLEIVEAGAVLVGVNTLLPNRLVERAVLERAIPELAGHGPPRREVRVGRSRIDLVLGREAPLCYVEIKNVTLVEGGVARFPDAVTERGRRHLEELARLVQRGHRAVTFFLVQRADGQRLRPADDIDPRYGRALRRAVRRGVDVLAYRAAVSPRGVALADRIPLELARQRR